VRRRAQQASRPVALEGPRGDRSFRSGPSQPCVRTERPVGISHRHYAPGVGSSTTVRERLSKVVDDPAYPTGAGVGWADHPVQAGLLGGDIECDGNSLMHLPSRHFRCIRRALAVLRRAPTMTRPDHSSIEGGVARARQRARRWLRRGQGTQRIKGIGESISVVLPGLLRHPQSAPLPVADA
jgi:hypothetical protein